MPTVTVVASLARTSTLTRAATVTPVATLPRTRFQTITVVRQLGVTLQRQLAATLSASQTVTASQQRRAFKPVAATVTPAATVSRAKVYALVLTTVERLKPGGVVQITLTATQAVTATLAAVRVITKTLTTTQAQSVSLKRQGGKQLHTGSMMALPPVFQSIGTIASLSFLRTQGRAFTATVTPAAVLGRRLAAELDAATQQSATLSRSPKRTLTTVQALAAAVNQLRGVTFAAAVAQAGTVERQAQARLAAIQQTTADCDLRPSRTLSAAALALADLAAIRVAVLEAFAATVTATATLKHDAAIELDADPVATAATLVRLAAARLEVAAVGTAAESSLAVAKTLETFQQQASTLRRDIARRLPTATIASVATLQPTARRLKTLTAGVRIRARLVTDHPAIFKARHTGRIIAGELGHIAHAVAGRIETFIERLD